MFLVSAFKVEVVNKRVYFFEDLVSLSECLSVLMEKKKLSQS